MASDPDDSRPEDIEYSIEGTLTQDNNFRIDPNGKVYLEAPGDLDRDYPNGYNNWQVSVWRIDRVRNLKFATYLKFATCENTNKINEFR